jgi:hypothetical protein
VDRARLLIISQWRRGATPETSAITNISRGGRSRASQKGDSDACSSSRINRKRSVSSWEAGEIQITKTKTESSVPVAPTQIGSCVSTGPLAHGDLTVLSVFHPRFRHKFARIRAASGLRTPACEFMLSQTRPSDAGVPSRSGGMCGCASVVMCQACLTGHGTIRQTEKNVCLLNFQYVISCIGEISANFHELRYRLSPLEREDWNSEHTRAHNCELRRNEGCESFGVPLRIVKE